MNSAQVNRRIQDFLRDLADEEPSVCVRRRDILSVLPLWGSARSFSLCWTPGGNYQKYAVWNLNRFVSSSFGGRTKVLYISPSRTSDPRKTPVLGDARRQKGNNSTFTNKTKGKL